MVRNVTENIRILVELTKDEQSALASAPNVHFAKRMALIANRGIHSARGIKTTGLESTTILSTIAR